MMNGAQTLPPEIAAEAGELISELSSAGWAVHASQFDARCFGNWFVDLWRGNRTLRLVKDRSIFEVDGPSVQRKKEAGLWRGFESFKEFHEAIRNFAIVDRR